MLNVYIDGSCAPVNPGGTASYGLIVKRGESLIFQTGKVVGVGKEMSNNVAEYKGLLSFLSWYISYAKEYDNKNNNEIEQVIVHSDSQLLVNQMNRKWKATSGLYYPYYKSAILLTQYYKNIEYKWIPREENSDADNLANEAIANERH